MEENLDDPGNEREGPHSRLEDGLAFQSEEIDRKLP
jgi:hypothetical protein